MPILEAEGLVLADTNRVHHGEYLKSPDVRAFVRAEVTGGSATRSSAATPVGDYRREAR